MQSALRSSLFLGALAVLAGCGTRPSVDSPGGTVALCVEALEKNDVKTFVTTVCTDEQYRELATEWTRVAQMEATPEDVTEWRDTMKKLTGPGAEAKIMAEITPQLEEVKPQWDMMVGFFSQMGEAGIESNQALSAKERREAKAALKTLTAWASENDVTSVEKAREAVAKVCKTARRMDVPEYADLQSMSLDEVLAMSDTLLDGVKDVLDVYGISIDDMLATVDVATLNESPDWALVEISFDFLGSEQSFETEMVRIDGRWVSKSAQEHKSLVPGTLSAGIGL